VSDNAQTLVWIDCPADGAAVCGEAVLRWLTDNDFVEVDLSNCVLGGSGLGRRPGRRLDQAVVGDPKPARSLATNGVMITTERSVFDTGGNGIVLRCSRCGAEFEPGDDYVASVDKWASGEDEAEYRCPTCGGGFQLIAWDGPCAWAFGHLGVTFWNWPPLAESFVESLGSRVPGRVRLVREHI
jgi:DNA-directed RNA polymerase subunit RPC12/RpoP